jgi:DNA gyrase/topoisomerase IV subunit B
VRFRPDDQIFGKGAQFKAARLFRMARSKAYLFGGVEIRWRCAPSALPVHHITSGVSRSLRARFHIASGHPAYPHAWRAQQGPARTRGARVRARTAAARVAAVLTEVKS